MNKNAAGRVISYEIPTTVSNTTTSPINSNISVMKSGKTSGLVQLTNRTGNILGGSQLRGVGSKIVTAGTKIAAPAAILGTCLWLGKTIDEIAYAVNPDILSAIGVSAENLNPQTWAQSIFPDNELGQNVLNLLLGIDPDTGEAQTYMDADTLAYLAYVLQDYGIFNTGDINVPQYGANVTINSLATPSEILTWWLGQLNNYASTYGAIIRYRSGYETYTENMISAINALNTTPCYIKTALPPSQWIELVGPTFELTTITTIGIGDTVPVGGYTRYNNCNKYQLNLWVHTTDNVKYIDIYATSQPPTQTTAIGFVINPTFNYGTTWSNSSAEFNNINAQITSAIEGVTDQPNATLPNFEGLTEDQYLPYLQNLYPDSFTDAINYPVLQPDGTTDNHTYIPIPFPSISNWADTQPLPSDSLQASPEIDPITATQDLVDTLVKVLQQPQPLEKTDTDTGYPNPPTNQPDTGDGTTPAAPAPTGSASALWSIYHPSQAQLDSFGAWLWSSNFVDQILKIFNDPMQSIIGLHKIYATPIDAGSSTIAVGYLNSGVPSATVTQQYVSVDCGSVDLGEYFGNAFDYAPYTSVQLYLPFVGIVPLDVAQVMRSTISVVYEVDIFTGACLAKVDVTRDGGGGTLYQYSGDCAARYPLSSGSYMGIVSGIISIAGGIAATVATGGGAAPIALGAAGAALSAHTDVQHSGAFSGNAGAMGGKVPYLIINRPQTALADDVGHMAGYPANQTERIGDCSGYIRATEVHDLAPSGATSDEVQQIIDAIKEGIIV